jgi:hypothetical protein
LSIELRNLVQLRMRAPLAVTSAGNKNVKIAR